jgi:CBS domain-containing protein
MRSSSTIDKNRGKPIARRSVDQSTKEGPMNETIRDVVRTIPLTMAPQATVMEAAQIMRENDIGDVLVLDNGRLYGILTDRDIVVRGLAQGCDPAMTRVGDICSRELITVSLDERLDHAVRLMRDRAVRRLPVEDAGRVVGIVTIGDLALERDRHSLLADISAAPPNV